LKITEGISGASGAAYGLRVIERLRQKNVEIHLILTRSGEKTQYLETAKLASDVKQLSDFSYSLEDISSRLASGSFPVDAMVMPILDSHHAGCDAQRKA